jgi:uncharacterized metal-binding protein YceD (DUF177 family)
MAAHPEFSRLIAIEGITPDKVRKEAIEASEAECAALAKRFDLRELSNLKAKLNIRRISGGTAVRVEGKFEADVIQTCVVSLQDVHGRVQGHFDTFFAEEPEDTGMDAELSMDDDETSPEMITKGNIDLGEVVAQYLSLELDPYPRAPGVSLAAQLAEIGAEVKNSPFRVLEGLKDAEKAQKSAAGKQGKPVLKPVKAKKPTKTGKARKGKAK